jgi:hypothetical protein
MSIDLFKRRTMLAALSVMPPVRSFLLDTFFPNEKAHTTESVDIDIEKGARKMAAFVGHRREGRLIEREGFKTETYTPPYLKEKMITEAGMYLNRDAGMTIYGDGLTPEQRAGQQVGKDLAVLDARFDRREEWMASQAVTTGVVDVYQHDDSNSLVKVNSIDFQRSDDNKIVHAGEDLWTDTTNSDPLQDMRDWKRMIVKKTGHNPTVCIMQSLAWQAFINHPKVKEDLDNRRITIGEIKPQDMPKGVIYLGYLNDPGLHLYSYPEWYVDETDDTEKALVPENGLVMGCTTTRNVKHYGMIRDLKAMQNFAVKRFVKSWEQDDPSARFLLMQSAPLIVPHQPDAFVYAQPVIDA